MTEREAWIYSVGLLPYKVTAYEDKARKWVVYLKWRSGAAKARDWTRISVGVSVRKADGRLDRAATKRVEALAHEQYERLIGRVPAMQKPFSLADGLARIIDPAVGKYPVPSAHRKEIERVMHVACATLGSDTAWTAIERGDIRKLWRTELARQRRANRRGVRPAEILISRFFTLAGWLRDEELIPPSAARSWKGWRDEFRKDAGEYEPSRPRYTLDEVRRIMAAAPKVNPMFELLAVLGVEYRLGQVRRLMRNDIDLERSTHGAFVIRGAGKKRGALVLMTKGQRAVLDRMLTAGYLAGMERDRGDANYAIFPGGHFPQSAGVIYTKPEHRSRAPITRDIIGDWWIEAEAMAGVPHVRGRGYYSARRTNVDEVKRRRISREGLKAAGGWSDTQIPDQIYAEQEQAYGAEEARDLRAAIRGEAAADPSAESPDDDAPPPSGGDPRAPIVPSETEEKRSKTEHAEHSTERAHFLNLLSDYGLGEWAREELNLRPHAYQASNQNNHRVSSRSVQSENGQLWNAPTIAVGGAKRSKGAFHEKRSFRREVRETAKAFRARIAAQRTRAA